jgi:flavin reductase (DIM6/NTAB) family NADH-FMN oxidoreductase RutF
VTIHSTDPFATPAGDRSQVRRLRSRLAAPVTVWTAPGPAGLTVSSVLVADGTPGRVLGLINDESALWEAIQAGDGRFAVTPLAYRHRQLADRFAGVLPSPGGLFRFDEWTGTPYGPVLAGAATWAGCRRETVRPCGWGYLVEAVIEEITIGPDEPTDSDDGPLLYQRGRYRRLA